MSMRRSRAARFCAVAVAVCAATATAAVPATAAEAAEQDQVCWLNADDGSFACFDSQEEFASASGAEVAGGATSALGIEPYATYVIATFYENASFGGSSINVTTSNASLCAGYHYYGPSMPAGWNDRVSSFKGYGTCKVKLWANASYGGASYGPFASSSALGSMNDEASSYQVYATS